MSDPHSDAEISRDIAHQAGQLLLRIRRDFFAEHGEVQDKETANKLRDAADAASNDLILDFLATARPGDAVLSEEAKDNEARLDSDRVWIVDPLDGTWEYGQNRRDFAVHVALWAGGELHACSVDLPAQELARTVLDPTEELVLDTSRPVRIVASRSRPPATLDATCAALARILQETGINEHGVEIVDVGSVGAKVNEILSGRADAYVHDTGFYEWDVAAPLAVARAAGMRATHIDGAEVTFNHRPPYVTDLMVARPEVADAVSAAVKAQA